MSASTRIAGFASGTLSFLLWVFVSQQWSVIIGVGIVTAGAYWLAWQWVKGQDRRRGRQMVGARLGPDGKLVSASRIGGSDRD